MPYTVGSVPAEYSASFFANELNRIAQAYNIIEAFGGLALNGDDFPAGIDQVIPVNPTVINAWQSITPNPAFSDGAVQTDPDVLDKDIEVLNRGIYLVSFYAAYDHINGAEIIGQFFLNGLETGLGFVNDASQQTSASTESVSGLLTLQDNDVIDMRVSGPNGDEPVTWLSGQIMVYKLRDLRRRFS